jgi:hypothetical protein
VTKVLSLAPASLSVAPREGAAGKARSQGRAGQEGPQRRAVAAGVRKEGPMWGLNRGWVVGTGAGQGGWSDNGVPWGN